MKSGWYLTWNEQIRSKFKIKPMSENNFISLETTVCLEKEDLSLEFYGKESASNCLYKHAVYQKIYKISTLCSEIHRVNCTFSDEKLKKPIKIKSIYYYTAVHHYSF